MEACPYGYQFDRILNHEYNAGITVRPIIDALKTNNTIGWQFVASSDEAIEGVYSGEYYAALVVPENFSKNLISFLSDSNGIT